MVGEGGQGQVDSHPASRTSCDRSTLPNQTFSVALMLHILVGMDEKSHPLPYPDRGRHGVHEMAQQRLPTNRMFYPLSLSVVVLKLANHSSQKTWDEFGTGLHLMSVQRRDNRWNSTVSLRAAPEGNDPLSFPMFKTCATSVWDVHVRMKLQSGRVEDRLATDALDIFR